MRAWHDTVVEHRPVHVTKVVLEMGEADAGTLRDVIKMGAKMLPLAQLVAADALGAIDHALESLQKQREGSTEEHEV